MIPLAKQWQKTKCVECSVQVLGWPKKPNEILSHNHNALLLVCVPVLTGPFALPNCVVSSVQVQGQLNPPMRSCCPPKMNCCLCEFQFQQALLPSPNVSPTAVV